MQAYLSAAIKLLCLAAVVSSSILDFRPSYRNNKNIARKRALKVKNNNLGQREESEVAGFFVFSHIRMMGYFRLS